MTWRIATSLETLRKQLNEAFPKRSTASDGGIGDAKHASRSSDHNPWVIDDKERGVVTARDFTHDPATGIDCQWLADTLVKNKDPRIKYIIWNSRICSSKQSPWKWRAYKGLNAHTKHLHLSVSPDPKLYDSKTQWTLDFPEDESDDVAKVSAATSPTISNLSNISHPSASNPTVEPPPITEGSTTQIADNIVNTGDTDSVPGNFVEENKTVNAPPKEGSTTQSVQMTIAGMVVPPVIVAIIRSIQELVDKGYLNAKEVGDTVLGFIFANQKYVFLLIGMIIALLMIKKLFKQITLWIEMWLAGDPKKHNVKVKPQ